MLNIKSKSLLGEFKSDSSPWQSEKGATAVEFAIILFPLVLLLFGIIEFGTFMFNKQVITNASREGARAGIVSRIPRVSDTEIEKVVNDYCKDNMITFGEANDPITSTIPDEPDDEKFGDLLTVTVTFDYDFLFLPFSTIPMNAKTVMRYE